MVFRIIPRSPAFHQRSAGLIICGVFFLTACATTTGPSINSQEVSARKKELAAKAEIFKQAQIKRVSAIAQRIISFMPPEEQEKLKTLQYDVSEDENINAFIVPNKLVVTYGMLRFATSDDELATVVSHELAHLVKGHYGKKLATTLIATVAGIAAGAAIEGVTQGSGLGGPVMQGVTQGVAGGFSRDYEREADYFGYQYVYLAGFDLKNGSKIWERFSIEAPKQMPIALFSSHPEAVERLLRAEKVLNELAAQGVQPNLFSRPSEQQIAQPNPGAISKTVAVSARAVAAPVATLGSTIASPLKIVEGQTSLAAQAPSAAAAAPTEDQKEIEAIREEIKRLKAQEEQRLKKAQNQAAKEIEMVQVLLEAKEAAKKLRYAEFGVQEMGLAKKVVNLWLGKSVSGQQRIFPLQQKRVDWFVQYGLWSGNSWWSLGLIQRKYKAYWYAPNGRLFCEQDFIQSKVRYDFAQTTLEWDADLGKFLVGEWLLRVFEDGKFLDERTFEVVA